MIMKHLTRVLALMSILIFCSPQLFYARPDAPPYAKWGQLAMKTAKDKYPKADIIDYLHIGRVDKDQVSTEKFKLWLREDGKEFGLFIDIDFNPANEQVKQIHMKKSAT